ncbi:hypothetical protein NP493_891g00031 [Ridgeia piscesae]|uniref:Uncharacterized protein n=1 Tax=Ridgeia piscesae TaxID=27915 RepID=A0AAD9KKF9_RIDPI|nr:hypothetical protein NP493_891g00031 [Ridgeia piscesae]
MTYLRRGVISTVLPPLRADEQYESSSGGGTTSRTHSFDIGRQSELTRLYNQPVRRVTHVERPIGRLPMIRHLRHTGVVVETEDGRRFLIHKVRDHNTSVGFVIQQWLR